MTNKPFRLAIIGCRGIPADLPKAGGGERETEVIATRLAQLGHHIIVYCRWHYNRHPESPWRGVELVSLPSINTKDLDTVTHTFLASIHAIYHNKADIVAYHGMGNALFLPILRMAGKKTVVYMDGVDWERPKWSKFAKFMLWLSANMAFRMADRVYVDNAVSQKIFTRLFKKEPLLITLGADLRAYPGSDQLNSFGLTEEKYILFVGLLKRDKGVHILIEAYNKLDTPLPLVIVGDCPDEPKYVQSLKEMADNRVHFLGYVYGEGAQQLFANCYIYVQPSIMEGNSPSLMTAMSYGRCCLVSNIEQNLETIGDGGLSFRVNDALDLLRLLEMLLKDESKIKRFGSLGRERIEKYYNWNGIVNQLENLCIELVQLR